jgi:hypothetical protein
LKFTNVLELVIELNELVLAAVVGRRAVNLFPSLVFERYNRTIFHIGDTEATKLAFVWLLKFTTIVTQ